MIRIEGLDNRATADGRQQQSSWRIGGILCKGRRADNRLEFALEPNAQTLSERGPALLFPHRSFMKLLTDFEANGASFLVSKHWQPLSKNPIL